MSSTRKMPVVLAYSLLPAMGAVVVGMDAEAVVADAVVAMGVRRVAAAMAAEGVGVGAAAGVVGLWRMRRLRWLLSVDRGCSFC